MSDATQATPHVATITVRQREVLDALLYDGATDATIGRRLGIDLQTVKSHMRKIYRACAVGGRSELIVGLFRGHIRLNVVNGQERAK